MRVIMLHINQIIKNPNWKLLRKDNPDHLFSKLPSEFPTRGPIPLRWLATSSQGMENNLKFFNLILTPNMFLITLALKWFDWSVMRNCKNVFAHGKSLMLDQMFWANANTVEPGFEKIWGTSYFLSYCRVSMDNIYNYEWMNEWTLLSHRQLSFSK